MAARSAAARDRARCRPAGTPPRLPTRAASRSPRQTSARKAVGCGLAFLDLALRRCRSTAVGWRGACAAGDAAGPLRRETTIVLNPLFIPFTPLLAPLSPTPIPLFPFF